MASAKVKFSEWLPDGVIVHFTDGQTVFFSSQYLWDRRDEQQVIPDVAADATELSFH